MSEELTPFVRDLHYCNVCHKETRYVCPHCSSLAHKSEVYVCPDCAIKRKEKLYCPNCNQKLYRIQPRFVGSYRSMKKNIKNFQHKIWVEPKVHGPDERDQRLRRDEL